MQTKNLQIFLVLLEIFFFANFLSAADSQLYQSCGGDEQAALGCLGDAEFSFTGAATSQPQGPPSLEIIKPKNETYFNGNSMKVQIETNSDDAWYNIDNGENTTIPPSNKAPFQAEDGTHTVYVFANNSFGITAKNFTFTVNSTRITINNSGYGGSDKGETTNFNEYSYEEIQNISDVILEKTGKGKIKFNTNINFTDDENPGDDDVDLDSHIIISTNRIEINSAALPNFNKSATLSLYGLSFANPQILMDGSPCPESICTEGSYSGGTLEFNVTHFTVYTTRETPASDVITRAAGGGSSKECSDNSDCKTPGYGICWNNECVVRLFDVKILEFESPIELGDFFSFTYSLKDMANIDSDVNVDFWIEKDGTNITSGSAVVFVGGLKEIIETGKLFIPEDINSGSYTFYIQISNKAEIAKIHRTIQIEVDDEKGTATITPVPEGPSAMLIILILLLIIIVIFFYITYSRQKQRIAWLQKMMRKVYGSKFKAEPGHKTSKRKTKASVKEIIMPEPKPIREKQMKLKEVRPATIDELVEEAKINEQRKNQGKDNT